MLRTIAHDGQSYFEQDCFEHIGARERAHNVLSRIGNPQNRQRTLEDSDCHHQLFANLYYHTTHRWLEHLAGQTDPILAYLVIERFYDLYDLYVRQVIEEKRTDTAPQWKPYFKVAARIKKHPSRIARAQLAFLGARAHTRYDLAEAIMGAWQAYVDTFDHYPDLTQFRELMLSDETSPVFFSAAIDFASPFETSSQNLGANPLRPAASVLRHLWLPAFQFWRHAAWKDAERWIHCQIAVQTSRPQTNTTNH